MPVKIVESLLRLIRCRVTSARARATPTDPELAKRFPLSIVPPKSHGFLNYCYANMEQKIKGQGEQFVMINKVDADRRGIVDGDRGAFKGVARITDDVNGGIVVATLGCWRQH